MNTYLLIIDITLPQLADPVRGCSLYVKTSDKVNTSWEQGKLIQIRSTSSLKYKIRLQNKMTVMANTCNIASWYKPDKILPEGNRVIAVFKVSIIQFSPITLTTFSLMLSKQF